MKIKNPLLDDPYLKEFLGSKHRETRKGYQRAWVLLKIYVISTGKKSFSPKSFLMKKKNSKSLKCPVVALLNGFIPYLEKKYSPKTVNRLVSGITEFFRFYGQYVVKKNLKLPKPLTLNNREALEPEQVKIFLNHCRTLRDKTLCIALFQTGLRVGTLCALNVRDVLDPVLGSLSDPPLVLSIPASITKTGVAHYTCLGRNACDILKLYLDERKRTQGKLGFNDPLFLSQRKRKEGYRRMTPTYVSQAFLSIAERSGLVSPDRLKNSDISPISPHCLRKSFSTCLIYAQCPDEIVNFLLGHSGRYDRAYFGVKGKKIREIYSEYEPHLSIDQREITATDERIAELEKSLHDYKLFTCYISCISTFATSEDPKKLNLIKSFLIKVQKDRDSITNKEMDDLLSSLESIQDLTDHITIKIKGGENHGKKRKRAEERGV